MASYKVSNYGKLLKEHPRLEWVLYLVIVILAMAFRFVLLGNHPLDDHQSTLALQALAVSKGENVPLSGEPGYITLTAVLFFLFRDSDFIARVWPALFGVLLVLLPLLYRRWLGRKTTLLLAGLIAFDPVLITASRTADGSMLAMVGLLAAVGFWINRRPVPAGICIGIALLGGVNFWSGFFVLAVLWLIFGRRILGITDDLESETPPTRTWWMTAGIAALTVFLISTILFTYPHGISSVGAGLVEFFSSWGKTGSLSLTGAISVWLLLEAPVILLALWNLVDGLLKGNTKQKVLGVWLGLSLGMFILNPVRSLPQLIWVALPILFLATLQLVQLFENWEEQNLFVFLSETALVIAMLGFSFLNLLNLINSASLLPEEYRNRIIGTLLPLILLAAMTILLAWGWSSTSTLKGLLAGFLVLFLLIEIGTAWKSANLGSRPENEFTWNGGYPVGEQLLKTTIEDVARWNSGVATSIDVQVVGTDLPSLNWALRIYETVSFEPIYNPNLTPSIVITSADLEIKTKASYRGQNIVWLVKPDEAIMKWVDWIKWALFRVGPIQKTDLILWVRNDLFPGGTTP